MTFEEVAYLLWYGKLPNQTELDRILVRIVPGPGYDTSLTQHLVTELQARLGADVRIDVEMVDRLEPSANGKFKWVISKVPLGI